MATHSPRLPVPERDGPVIAWLLESDPSLRWQVLRDLTGASADEVTAARARVTTAGGKYEIR